MNAVIETIDADKARAYLSTSNGNRPLNKAVIKTYANAMLNNRWLVNGVSIIFDKEGHLIDGHHRLEAIKLANVPVQISVCRGVDNEAFATYDCGFRRNTSHLLAMQGVKDYTTVASIIAASYSIMATGRIYSSNTYAIVDGKKSRMRTNEENFKLYEQDPDGYEEAAAFSIEMRRRAKLLHKSWVGGMYYYLTRVGGFSESSVRGFFENLLSLNESEYSPIEAVRKKIINTKIKGASLNPTTLWALIVKAWNAYIPCKPVKVISFNPETEELPTLFVNKK